MWFNSLASRLAGGFALIGALALSGASLYLDRALRTDIDNRATRELLAKSEAMRELIGELASAAEVAPQRQRFEEPLLGHEDISVAVFDAAGRRLLVLKDKHAVIDALAAVQAAPEPIAAAVSLATIAARPFRTIVVAAKARDGVALSVGVALDMTEPQTILDAYRGRVLNVLLLGVVLLAAAALLTTRLALAPLRAMEAQARTITATRLSGRLPTERVPTELASFAGSFNGALDRLEESFARLTQFSADLAHDLRTPIANLRGEVEVALSRPRSVAEYQEALGSAVEEYDRLNRMIEAMLFLARADNAQVGLKPERFDAVAEIRSLFDYFDALAETQQVTLRVEGAAAIVADRALFRRALTNLLSNALRHAREKTDVVVRLAAGDDRVTSVAVENSGDPIPAALRPRLFNRFARADPARSDSSDRSGLGLAIVQSIMTMHGGSVVNEPSADGTTRFVLRFPGARSEHSGS